jgi:hypothetical protein
LQQIVTILPGIMDIHILAYSTALGTQQRWLPIELKRENEKPNDGVKLVVRANWTGLIFCSIVITIQRGEIFYSKLVPWL